MSWVPHNGQAGLEVSAISGSLQTEAAFVSSCADRPVALEATVAHQIDHGPLLSALSPAGEPTTIRTTAALDAIALKHPSLAPQIYFDLSV